MNSKRLLCNDRWPSSSLEKKEFVTQGGERWEPGKTSSLLQCPAGRSLLSKPGESNLHRKVKVAVSPGKITHPLDFISLKGRNHLHFTSLQGIVVLTFKEGVDLEQTLSLAYHRLPSPRGRAIIWQDTILCGHYY